MINLASKAIAAVLLDADVYDDEFQTISTGVKSLTNSRSLTTISGDSNDGPVLTPNYFLISQIGGGLAPERIDRTRFNMHYQWSRV